MKRRTHKKRQARSEREVALRVKRERGDHFRWARTVAIRDAIQQMIRDTLSVMRPFITEDLFGAMHEAVLGEPLDDCEAAGEEEVGE